MKYDFDVIIIGGGVSGIVCAIECARNKRVALIEAGDKIGKKILVSGNGRCNLSNEDMGVEHYNSEFVAPILARYNCQKVRDKLLEYGLVTKSEDGRIYPYSESATAVLNVFLSALRARGVSVITNALATEIAPQTKGWRVATSQGAFSAEKVVIATGSKATFGLASYDLVKPLGIPSTLLAPTLVALKSKSVKGANGVRSKVRSCVEIDGKRYPTYKGEYLFKDGAISGVLALIQSSHVARASRSGYKRCTLHIDFVPDMTRQQLANYIIDSYNPRGGMLEGLLHKAIVANITTHVAMDRSLIMSEVKANAIAERCKDYVAEIDGTLGLNHAQAVCGGLSLDCFDTRTLESKTCQGLYATGEVLDVDGECGGYNIHWAIASGLAVAEDINA
ncbi:MAG: aminoacetone oxidase family FAD-binding enzyme [Christensenellales bacterium]